MQGGTYISFLFQYSSYTGISVLWSWLHVKLFKNVDSFGIHVLSMLHLNAHYIKMPRNGII